MSAEEWPSKDSLDGLDRLFRSIEFEQYRWGELPLTYSHAFENGALLVAEQDDSGFAKIRITRSNETVIDMAHIVPADCQLVTPTFLANLSDTEHARQENLGKVWKFDSRAKLIIVGPFDSQHDLLALLHELGHARCDSDADRARYEALATVSDVSVAREQLETTKQRIADFASFLSRIERRAWADAIRQLRRIEQRCGIKLFSSLQEMKEYVNTFLSTYREAIEEVWDAATDEGLRLWIGSLFDKNRDNPDA